MKFSFSCRLLTTFCLFLEKFTFCSRSFVEICNLLTNLRDFHGLSPAVFFIFDKISSLEKVNMDFFFSSWIDEIEINFILYIIHLGRNLRKNVILAQHLKPSYSLVI